ncbi:DNA ligase [Paraglaciecola sp.]|uniref:DNA ligase n=1 Tax=Paraglaciecola sp. TaxID=1920173 RepID=UPI0032670FA2
MTTTIGRLNLILTALFLFSTRELLAIEFVDSSTAHTAPTQQQLSQVYQDDIVVSEYWISEKLDGIRARWTGSELITRNGNRIHAPSWFVKGFGKQVLDGELWLARNSFEKTASIVLRDTPTNDWKHIKYMLFDLPQHKGDFTRRLNDLETIVVDSSSPFLFVIPHFKLNTKDQLMAKLDELVAQGAEGLMLHHQRANYQNGRSANLLKLKKHQDSEATVVAHLPGKGKYLGMLGAILVELDTGLQFKIGSGFSDLQRKTPPQVGATVTFKHYGYTAKGIPRFASFLRIRSI